MKKRWIMVFWVFCMLFLANASADKDTLTETRLLQTTSGRSAEHVTDLSEGWKFGGKNLDAFEINYPDTSWATVNLPHTWNKQDAADGDGKYSRSAYWYRKKLEITSPIERKRIYLEFLGANQKTDLYVNETHMVLTGSDEYTHKGGYTAFRYDITDALLPGENTLAIRVDNTYSEEIAPLNADFNMYGGIYRRVFLITVDEIHIDLSDNGSSGLFLTTPNIRSMNRPDDFGTLIIRADIVNKGLLKKNITVTAHIEGDNAPEDILRTYEIPAGERVHFNETTVISDPHLWKGIDYSGKSDNSDIGYCYEVTLTVSDGEKELDAVTDTVGFRYIYVDKETGFYLNGESHPLRGVNRHQFKQGMGSAILEAEHEVDIELIKELGSNTVRLSHYPQSDYFYDLCDDNGIIVWSEIPIVNAVGKDINFLNTSKKQLIELIRQQYNRPSICFWGLENEIRENTRSEYITAKQLLSELDQCAHTEDKTNRYTTQAINQDMAMDGGDLSNLLDDNAEIGWKSDLFGWNIYPGWYSRFSGTFEEVAEKKAALDTRPMALSEYGWGANVNQHELYPELGKKDLLPTGKWHPEEYQNLMHEQAIRYINTHDHLWATYIWCMFDFNVDNRYEGSQAALNDKGLVTNDRKTKKDSFYLYKANWDQREPFVYITSSRFSKRSEIQTYVKVYSNCDSVDLYMNGMSLGRMENMGNGVFLLEDLSLDVGENKMHAVGFSGEVSCDDTCVWIRQARKTTTLASDIFPVNNKAYTITLPHQVTVGEFRKSVTALENATYRILRDGKELTNERDFVSSGMQVSVLAENGETKKTYYLVPYNLFSGKKAVATTNEKGNESENAIDGRKDTRWVAKNNSYPQRLTVDLGESRYLGKLTIDWNTKGGRSYTYAIQISDDGKEFSTVSEHLNNKKSGMISENLNGVKARYIRIKILSCSNKKGYAAINEMKLDEWSPKTQ